MLDTTHSLLDKGDLLTNVLVFIGALIIVELINRLCVDPL